LKFISVDSILILYVFHTSKLLEDIGNTIFLVFKKDFILFQFKNIFTTLIGLISSIFALKLKLVHFFIFILHLAGFFNVILGGFLSIAHSLTVFVIDLE
jgi:hypothetical protein